MSSSARYEPEECKGGRATCVDPTSQPPMKGHIWQKIYRDAATPTVPSSTYKVTDHAKQWQGTLSTRPS